MNGTRTGSYSDVGTAALASPEAKEMHVPVILAPHVVLPIFNFQ